MENILSGIKPTGQLTLGNYIGALKNFAKFQDENKVFVFIADLHALTLPIDPEVLNQNTKDIVAFYLACGLDPNKASIFLQSHVHEHSELGTILGNYAYMGEMSRMTQFKDKTSKLNEKKIGLGLFTYPVLMAADILLYDAKKVPVGEDQKQHVELTRDLALRFNHRYKKDIFVIPEPVIPTNGARIMSLSDPTKKMSKSDPKGDIFLKDDPKVARKKIMSAVTDLDCKVKFDKENKPGISNLLTIYCSLKDISIQEAEEEFKDANYGTFKKAVADVVCSTLENIQAKYNEYINSNYMDEVLKKGAEEASSIAKVTLQRVKDAVGLLKTR
ncbi:MAG: tryptophan--tRNA ligase [Bacilli bacterium]|nr:tryptophan--tRNA ligase [Bacillales bacterium]MDY2574991.1 tryptophan--tRNA ligase [Bacilli bacterium]